MSVSRAANASPLLVRLTYVRGAHNRTRPHVKKALAALGFKKLQQSIVHKNILPIRGMIYTVSSHSSPPPPVPVPVPAALRSDEHTSELPSLMRTSYALF